VRRFFRILRNGLTALSLLLCVAIVVLWVRSYWVEDALVWIPQASERWIIASSRGQLAASHERIDDRSTFRRSSPRSLHLDRRAPSDLALRPLLNRYQSVHGDVWAGVGFFASEYRGATWWGGWSKRHQWFLSHWMAAALAGVLPARYAIRRRRSGVRQGICRECGYDLRATPERCPECGAIPDPAGSTGGRPGATRA
jgi:hypothetical protein